LDDAKAQQIIADMKAAAQRRLLTPVEIPIDKIPSMFCPGQQHPGFFARVREVDGCLLITEGLLAGFKIRIPTRA
jgi:hypothetical protein